ncbi:diaminopimelate epimerase [Cellulomonas fimi]|uniref:Diaminopimelate epimerase n=1 Tax=Cellulomonas fimi (strain ATCC 484 / DSM 20113 / JCM 1341 / CCUG 24087 / LMG 16345 / NBRC 15513 / NCIMB 8980 / NCTC 7547 / NRS-133) TaxID=590998 RepID=F4H780_CELFA|nr:diaminopimelate epimerase [Cellulomonas fimi]AEE45714.1 diaminopimelate epimerase [Cellulomonas fimi ATCC 484]NNH08415.1 diaminopimelate epimerase [Cellulomonas fimi]VEH30370.1 Diaminopimelate epimerase [Cellulomonas fimi]
MTTVPAPSAAPAAPPVAAGLPVTKGHGTQNDFVLLDDRDGLLDLTPALVRELADRRAGLGGDGVIRLVRSAHLPEGAALLADVPDATWFMDYRNADGSVAEMCGNGVRVVAAFAERLGLWDASDGELVLGTRAGVRRVRRVPVPDGLPDAVWYAVDMGRWYLPGGEDAVRDGFDAQVAVAGLADVRPALGVDVGNPHTVLALPGPEELDAADLTRAPEVRPVPPHGTNVELVVPLGETPGPDGALVGRVAMRVHERGVGETRSCGTGACAAALAVRTWAGAGAPDVWLVDVPGGTVRVTALSDGHVELAGPAVLVATATVDLAAVATRTP